MQTEDQILAMQSMRGWRTQRWGSSQPPVVREGFLGVVTQEFSLKWEGGSWPRKGWKHREVSGRETLQGHVSIYGLHFSSTVTRSQRGLK